nr:retrovirus-related Pol polyprotein from transposon TNT 1-94 [Tanacetum cinerariifolium]
MNKLVRHNLVRGLPTKCFTNDHNCTACLKEKQHKASCKIKVLVNKSQNKTPYELFNGMSPAIGFLKPFGYHVMILNTLDNLGKFKAKGDEGYFLGYSMSSKAFRVFNKRTKRVEENLHVDFLENNLIKKGAGPNWLFDIDSLTNSMNYVPVVVAGTNSTYFSGTKEAAGQDVKKDVSLLRYIILQNWFHKAHLESSTSNAQDTCIADAPESSGNSNPTATSTNPLADHMETLAVETPILTISSPVPTAYLNDSPEPSSDTRLISKRVTSQDNTPSLDNILSLTNRFEDILEVTTNTDDINRVKADLGNMETTITAGPTPTLKIHKDHPKSQIIFHVDTPIQTINKSKEKEEQSFIATIYQEEGIEYDEVFTPVIRIEAIRLFIAYASFMGFTVYQMDVKSAFLYGTIDEEVGTIDQTLFIIRHRGDFILVQVYVDDIIFGSSNPQLCREFDALMHEKFQMSAMVKRIFRYLKGHPKMGLWYPKESSFDLVAYSDSNYGGASQDRKSTTGGLSMPCEALSKEISSSILLLLIPLFWSTARIETTEEGTKILATVDGNLRIVFESSIMRNLKLNDEVGISSLPDAELFENLTLMGYNISPNQKFTFQKGRTVPLFDSMLVPHGEGSATPTEPHHTPSPEAQQTSPTTHSSPSLPPVPTSPLPTVIPTDTPLFRQYTRRTRIAQSLVLPPVADEPASPFGDDSQGEACPTDFGFKADQGSMQQKLDELMALCTSLQRQQSEMISTFALQELEINRLKARLKLLEDKDRGVAEQSGDDAPIKGRRLDEGEEAAERVKVATATVSIPTGSRVVFTASPTIPTAALIFTTATESTPYIRRKGKEKMVESETLKKKKIQEQMDIQMARELEEEMARDAQRMSEQIARDEEIAKIHAEDELQRMIDGLDRNNENVAKYLQEYQHWKQIQDFIPIGSKEEAERFKRKGLRLEQESVKKLKTLEEVKETKKVPEEKVKKMMQLVPVEEIYVEALQFKHPIIDREIYTEGQRSYWKIIRLGEMELWVELKRLYEPDVEDQLWTHTQNLMHALVEWKLYDTCGVHHVTSKDKEIFMLVEKDYPLRKGLAIIMISYKLQVENYSQMTNDLILKLYKIANCPSQQDD